MELWKNFIDLLYLVLGTVGFILIIYGIKSIPHNKLQECVGWCVCKAARHRYQDRELIRIICYEDWYIDEKYSSEELHFTSEEYKCVGEIIEKFNKALLEEYFCYKLTLPKKKRKLSLLTEEDFFWIKLYYYTSRHILNDSFAGHKMRGDKIDNNDGRTKYALTDFAVTMYKVCYKAYLAVVSSSVLAYDYQQDRKHHLEEAILTKSD